jgi:Family of unknown function (DUF6184)
MKLPLRGDGVGPRPIRNHTIAFFFFSGLAAACGHQYSVVGTTTMTSAAQPRATVTPEALDAIAGTRCMHEAKCDNVGFGRHYANYFSCMSELGGETLSYLTSYSCPNGTLAAPLDDCLADIRGERCSNERETIDHVTACSTTSLCPR